MAAPLSDDTDALAQRVRELKPESGREEVALALGRVTAALFGEEEAGAEVRVGRYLIRGVLGEGAMGRVLDAFDPKLERGVAIKLLHHHAAAEPSGGARLLREARALARLSHPNVIVVHEVAFCGPGGELVGEPPGEDARLFLVMERVDGCTLRQAVERLAMGDATNPERLLDWYLQSLEGLHAAHLAGIVHRDFKPDNVLVGVDGRVRVVDFGLARGVMVADEVSVTNSVGSRNSTRFDEIGGGLEREELRGPIESDSDRRDISSDLTLDVLTRSGALIGTPRYMAPEQLAGSVANALSDQFSLCVALFESYFGDTPFPARSIPTLLEAIGRGLSAHDTRSHDPLFDVLARGLAAEPSQRYADLVTLRDAIRACVGGRDVARAGFAESGDEDRELSASVPVPAVAQPERRLLSALGAVLAMVVAVAAVAYATGLVSLGRPAEKLPRSKDAEAAAVQIGSGDSDGALAATFAQSGDVAGRADRASDVDGSTRTPSTLGAELGLDEVGNEATIEQASGEVVGSERPPRASTTCFLHEDSFARLAHGRARTTLRVEGTCHRCRPEKRKARIARFSDPECDAYSLCASAADEECAP